MPGVRRRPSRAAWRRAAALAARCPCWAAWLASIAGIVLLAPLGISVLAAGADPRLPVAIRIALRDLVRYRARSGAALAAVTFAVFLATVICLVGSERTANPLNPSGPNLSSSQLVVTAGRSPAQGMMMPLTSAQEASLSRRLNSLAASLHARSAVPLESAAALYQAGAPAHTQFHRFAVRGHPAAARHVRDQGQPDRSRHRRPHLAARAGRPVAPADDLVPRQRNESDAEARPGGTAVRPARSSNDCLASPAIQTVSSLPSGTDAPNTVITEYAVRKYHLQTQLTGWLIQAPAPLTAAQIQAARRASLSPTRRRSRSPPAERISARSPTSARRSAS